MIRIAPLHLTVYGLLAGIVGTYLVMAMYYPLAYIWATYEDLLGEWSQFYLFVAAFIFSVRLAFSGSRYRIFFALLAVGCFYVFMEEISWGQRIIGFASPEFFQRHNLQRQVNLHNFLVGPFHTPTKAIVEYTLATALVAYGLVYPLAVRFGWAASTVQRLRIPAPPLYLWPYFVIEALLEVGLFRFNEAEIAEVLIGLALGITAVHYYVEQSPPSDCDGGAKARRRTLMVLLMFGSTLTLAAGTTYGLYAVPHVAAKTDRRIINGIEKFAGRYMRYEQYEMAAQLYQRLHAERPTKTSIVRKLARAYRKVGDEGRYREYIDKALGLDLDAYRRRPERVSVNLSLVRTYHLPRDRAAGQSRGPPATSAPRGKAARPAQANECECGLLAG